MRQNIRTHIVHTQFEQTRNGRCWLVCIASNRTYSWTCMLHAMLIVYTAMRERLYALRSVHKHTHTHTYRIISMHLIRVHHIWRKHKDVERKLPCCLQCTYPRTKRAYIQPHTYENHKSNSIGIISLYALWLRSFALQCVRRRTELKRWFDSERCHCHIQTPTHTNTRRRASGSPREPHSLMRCGVTMMNDASDTDTYTHTDWYMLNVLICVYRPSRVTTLLLEPFEAILKRFSMIFWMMLIPNHTKNTPSTR